MMCQYCEGEKYLSDDLLSSAKIQKLEDIKGDFKFYTLVINNSTYIRIKYCPMCGRQLGGLKNE